MTQIDNNKFGLTKIGAIFAKLTFSKFKRTFKIKIKIYKYGRNICYVVVQGRLHGLW